MRTLLHCLPTRDADMVTHAVWHYVVARAVAYISHRWGIAAQHAATTVLCSEFRGLLTRAPRMPAHCVLG